MLWLATVAAVAGWTAAGVWMALWLRQRRHVRIAWRVASQAVAQRRQMELARPAVMVIGGERTVENVEAVMWLN